MKTSGYRRFKASSSACVNHEATYREDRQTHEAMALATHAQHRQAVAQLDRAKVNLERTEIRSPVNGWVTNPLAQQGVEPIHDLTQFHRCTIAPYPPQPSAAGRTFVRSPRWRVNL
jgi:hypothetical protein